MRALVLVSALTFAALTPAQAFRPMPPELAAKPPIHISITDAAGHNAVTTPNNVLGNPIKISASAGYYIIGGSAHPFQPPPEAQFAILIDESYDVLVDGPPYPAIKDRTHLQMLEKGAATLTLPKGRHTIQVVAINQQGAPYAARMVSAIMNITVE